MKEEEEKLWFMKITGLMHLSFAILTKNRRADLLCQTVFGRVSHFLQLKKRIAHFVSYDLCVFS